MDIQDTDIPKDGTKGGKLFLKLCQVEGKGVDFKAIANELGIPQGSVTTYIGMWQRKGYVRVDRETLKDLSYGTIQRTVVKILVGKNIVNDPSKGTPTIESKRVTKAKRDKEVFNWSFMSDCNRANNSGIPYIVSNERLAKEYGWSVSKIKQNITRLKRAGKLTVITKRVRRGSNYFTDRGFWNRYTFEERQVKNGLQKSEECCKRNSNKISCFGKANYRYDEGNP